MVKTNLNPSENHLANIETWLADEWIKTKNGFYCHWEIITEAFAEKRLSVITDNDCAIGFVIYRIDEFRADIKIAEIKPTERNKGVAKALIYGTLEHFRQENVLITTLYCSPKNSEAFWKRIGFKNYPKLIDDSQIYMFKPLVECSKPKAKSVTDCNISLWDCFPNQKEKTNAKWIWDLIFLSDEKTLLKPIILPTSGDWTISLVKKGKEILTTKVKNFKVDLADYPGFTIIRKVEV